MSFTNLIIVLNAIFLGGDAINSEKYNKTALLIYPLPQRRTAIFMGKFMAQLLTSWTVIAIFYGTSSVIISIAYRFDSLSSEIIKSILFAFVYMTALMSLAFFLSSLVNNPASSMMFTFFIVFMLLPITSMILAGIDYNTSWILTNYSSIITDVFRFSSSSFGPPNITSESINFNKGVNLCLIYSLIFTAFSWYYSMKQEV